MSGSRVPATSRPRRSRRDDFGEGRWPREGPRSVPMPTPMKCCGRERPRPYRAPGSGIKIELKSPIPKADSPPRHLRRGLRPAQWCVAAKNARRTILVPPRPCGRLAAPTQWRPASERGGNVLTAARNDLLTRVGPGTPMGDLLRRYWQPIGGARELEKKPVKTIRLMGEHP